MISLGKIQTLKESLLKNLNNRHKVFNSQVHLLELIGNLIFDQEEEIDASYKR